MKNGLKLTLMTVALAFSAMMAQASTPIITGVPSTLYVGDAEAGVTVPNDFVYPTDIDLEASVSDDDPPASMTWSYKETGTQTYTINNAPAAASGATDTDLVAPATWLYTNSSATNDPADTPGYAYQHTNSDNDPKTITIRNSTLSPIGGTPYSDPGAAGVITGSDAVIELIVSDSTSVGEHKLINVYTVNDDVDGSAGASVNLLDTTFTDGTHGWIKYNVAPAGTGITGNVDGALGLCINVGNTASTEGDMHYDSGADVTFASPSDDYNTGYVSLVANSAYRVRTELSTSATATETPSEPMTLIQWTSKLTTWGGANLYLDNNGHANSHITGKRTTVDTWVTPPGVLNNTWNNGLAAGTFTEYPYGLAPGTDSTAYDLTIAGFDLGYIMDFKIFFRVYDRSNDINSSLRNGQVCMKRVLVDRFSTDDLSVDSTVYDSDTFATPGIQNASGADPAVATTGEKWTVSDFRTNSSTNFSGGVLTIAPQAAGSGWGVNALVTLRPGTGIPSTANPTTGTNTFYTSSFPLPWVTDQLLLGRFYMGSGVDNAHMGQSVDNILIGFDSPTVEIAGVSFMTGNGTRALSSETSSQAVAFNDNPIQPFGPSMPKFTPEEWVVLYNSNTKTAADSLVYGPGLGTFSGQPIFANSEHLRPRLDVTVDATSPNGNTVARDLVRLTRVKVDNVSF